MSFVRSGEHTAPSSKGTSATATDTGRSAGGASAPPPAATGASQGTPHNDKVDVKADSLRGAGYVRGNQFNYFYGKEGQEGPATPRPWEDELIAVSRLPEPGQVLNQEEVERRTTALQASRLLLLRHSSSRQQDAEANMQGVLLALRRREPDRQAFVTSFDTVIPLRKLAHDAWREDRRGSVLYLYRSDDPASLDFFNRIEQVDILCAQLAAMDCYLLLTVSNNAMAGFRCEHELDRHIGLWSFTSTQEPESQHFDQLVSGRFDLTLASCAALFPGLSADEFTALVKLLSARPDTQPPATATAPTGTDAIPTPVIPPSRRDRWWLGEQGSVLSELGLRLQKPPQSNDASGEATYAGIFFEDAARRGEMPSWLYDRHAFLLAEQFPALAEYYLTPQASRRFGTGYRRLVLQLDAIGVCPLTSAWLTRQVQAALNVSAPHTAIQRIAELVAALPDAINGERLIGEMATGLGELIVTEESRLQEQLSEPGILGAAAAQERTPRPFDFWYELHGTPAARLPIEQAVQRQAMLIDLLLALSSYAPQAVVRTIGNAMNECNAAHQRWLRAEGQDQRHGTSMSLARMMFRARLPLLLRHDPRQWLAIATAVGQIHPQSPTSHPSSALPHLTDTERRTRATGCWLAWECLYAIVALLGNLPDDPWPDAVYDELLGDDLGIGLGHALASLLLSAENRPDEDFFVDAETTLWIYHWLLLAVVAHKAGDLAYAEQVADALIGPAHAGFTSGWRMTLVELAVPMLEQDHTLRADATTRGERDVIARRLSSLQLVVRKLRSRVPAPAP